MKISEKLHETKHHGDILFPFDIYPCKIPQDFQMVPLHWNDTAEIIYVKKGMGYLQINTEWHLIKEGAICTIGPRSLHSIVEKKGYEMEYDNYIYDLSILGVGSADICAQKYLVPILAGELIKPLIINPGDEGYEHSLKILEDTERFFNERPYAYELAIKSMMLKLSFVLLQTYKNHPEESTTNVTNMERMKFVLKKLDAEYMNRLTIEEMADAIGCSSSHFMKWFKMMTATSFGTFLNNKRLSIAAERLRETDEKILVIAESVGFDNLSNFNRRFKARYGMTPSEYRKRKV